MKNGGKVSSAISSLESVRDFILSLDPEYSSDFVSELEESEHVGIWNRVRELAPLGACPETTRCAGGVWALLSRMNDIRRYAEIHGSWLSLDVVGKIDALPDFLEDDDYLLPGLAIYVNPGPPGGHEDIVTTPAYSSRGDLVRRWLAELPSSVSSGISVEEESLEGMTVAEEDWIHLPVYLVYEDSVRRTRV